MGLAPVRGDRPHFRSGLGDRRARLPALICQRQCGARAEFFAAGTACQHAAPRADFSEGEALSAMQIGFRTRLLAWLLKRRPPIYTLTPTEIQHQNQHPPTGMLAWLFLGARPALERVRDFEIPGRHGPIPIRIYYPSAEPDLPLVVFFHGGGWVTNRLEVHDVICRQVALHARALVAAVDYRLAPQYPFPIPLEDCYAAAVWLARQRKSLGARADFLGVAGDSAGGNLAASVCLLARDLDGPQIDCQILAYPAVDGTLSSESHQRLTDAPLLSQQAVRFFRRCYARTPADWQDPYFSPLLAASLRNLPPALVITAGCDPLHDEGEAYARRLQASQVAVEFVNYADTIHAFLNFPRFCRRVPEALATIGRYIRMQAGTSGSELYGTIEPASSE